MNDMPIRFRLDVAFDEEAQTYHANLYSLTDGKGVPMQHKSLRRVLVKASKLMRDKNSEVRHFPMPETSVIITPDSNGAPSLIIPLRN